MPGRGDIETGDLLGGKYRVDDVIGHGGMGLVLAATDLKLERSVAIKVLVPELRDDEESVTRFVREARAASRLSSEHSVRVHEIDELADGTPYIVMEYLVGQDLAAVLAGSGRLAPAEAVNYALQAILAIGDAHAAGIVHRDIKPANLFLTRRPDGTPLIKVLDFGLAKAPAVFAGAALTKSSAVFGSPQYMSPEQLKGSANVDLRTDIWALGVTLYELVTGAGPFDAGTVAELGAMIMRDPAVPAHERCREVPVGLSKVLMRCLEKDPTLRYPNVAELAGALEPYHKADVRGVSERLGRVLQTMTETVPALSLQGPPQLHVAATAPALSGQQHAAGPAVPHTITATGATFDTHPSRPTRYTSWAIAAGLLILVAIATPLLFTRAMHPGAPSAFANGSGPSSGSSAAPTGSALDRPSITAEPPPQAMSPSVTASSASSNEPIAPKVTAPATRSSARANAADLPSSRPTSGSSSSAATGSGATAPRPGQVY
jgi:eukaryotic-like serine/threonine-protein kinase